MKNRWQMILAGTIALVCGMTLVACGDSEEETASVTETAQTTQETEITTETVVEETTTVEEEASPYRVIGSTFGEEDDCNPIYLENATGYDIIGMGLFDYAGGPDGESTDQLMFVKNVNGEYDGDNVLYNDEVIIFGIFASYMTGCDMEIEWRDETVSTIHNIPTGKDEIYAASIRWDEENGLAYLVYIAEEGGEPISTLEDEIAYVAEHSTVEESEDTYDDVEQYDDVSYDDSTADSYDYSVVEAQDDDVNDGCIGDEGLFN